MYYDSKKAEQVLRERHAEHNRKSHPEDQMSYLDFLDECVGCTFNGEFEVEVENCDWSFSGRKIVFLKV